MSPGRATRRCILALEDGILLTGYAFGATGTQTGEVVFNTAMTGYQEIITDPSYCGQIVTMTCPHIGNYGVSAEDSESARPFARGFVVRELARRFSNARATQGLSDFLAEHGIIGIEGVDTRALTRHIRKHGAMRGVITTEINDPVECVRIAASTEKLVGADLVRLVAPKNSYSWTEGTDPTFTGTRETTALGRRVVAIDCGMKRNILRHLVDLGCAVRVVPPTTSTAEVLESSPDGVFVSNGPGDPAAVQYAIDLLRGLIGKVPIFGICLGHQLIALALGAKSFKLKFGHHGANHPVQNIETGKVEITSQNHGFAIDDRSLADVGGARTHINLNDKTLEGFVHREMPILAVQYHPEAAPGPHDASYLFDCFAGMMATGQAPSATEMADAQTSLRRRQAARITTPPTHDAPRATVAPRHASTSTSSTKVT